MEFVVCRLLQKLTGLQKSGPRRRILQCSTCSASLGFGEDTPQHKEEKSPEDETPDETPDETWRLNKWTLSQESSGHHKSYPPTPFLSAQLLTIIEDQAIRRFRLLSEHDEPNASTDESLGLRIWVFHTERIYASTALEDMKPRMGLKVYYIEGGLSPTTMVPGGVEEEIVVPEEAIERVRRELRGSTEVLPMGLRELRGWRAGTLERFTRKW